MRNSIGDVGERAYSIARGGTDFIEIASGYEAALKEFPNTKVMVIQILNGNLDYESLDMIYSQRKFDETQTVTYIEQHENMWAKTKHMTKNYIPIISFSAKERMNGIKNPFSGAFIYSPKEKLNSASNNKNELEYEKLIGVLGWLEKEYKVPLIILNLPDTSINKDGTIAVSDTNVDIWEKACSESGVIWIDMAEDWNKMYREKKELPYGFSNTRPGYGHLNPGGHEIIAERLYNTIKERGFME